MNCPSLKIVSISEKEVKVEIEGQPLSLSKKYFPESLTLKNTFKLFLFNGRNPEKIEDKNLAKLILEEILNGK